MPARRYADRYQFDGMQGNIENASAASKDTKRALRNSKQTVGLERRRYHVALITAERAAAEGALDPFCLSV